MKMCITAGNQIGAFADALSPYVGLLVGWQCDFIGLVIHDFFCWTEHESPQRKPGESGTSIARESCNFSQVGTTVCPEVKEVSYA